MGALVSYAAWGGPRLPPERAPTVRELGVPISSRADPRAVGAVPERVDGPLPSSRHDLDRDLPEEFSGRCADEMVFVEGEYCTAVEQTCTRWLDDVALPYARCGDYAAPARCTGQRQPMRFCIDRFEYTPPGEELPKNHASFVEASAVCKSLGKRVCTESEWNFACEGPDMFPYPYGWSRSPVCNQDREDLYEPNPNRQVLRDNRVPSGSMHACRSPFGVYDMTGNLDEPVLRESQQYSYPFRNALKGGWWMAARNRCRPATTAHGDHYRDIQIGIRCCANAAPRPGAPSGASGDASNLD